MTTFRARVPCVNWLDRLWRTCFGPRYNPPERACVAARPARTSGHTESRRLDMGAAEAEGQNRRISQTVGNRNPEEQGQPALRVLWW